MILPRTESKDILDSGSKSQQANKEQLEIFYLPTRGVQQTDPSCVLFGGTRRILRSGVCGDLSLLWSLLLFPVYEEVTFSEIPAHLLYSLFNIQ